MKLKTLSIVTLSLFLVSIFVYINENKRGTDLLSGSDYVKGLDINKIQKIRLGFKEDKKLVFVRDVDRFVIENHKSYPAASDKINDLIYKISNIRVKEKIASGADEYDLKKYELDKGSRQYLVELFDNDGKKTVAFRVGKSQRGKGNYLYKEGKKEVYLSKENLWINSSYKDFIKRSFVDVSKSDVEKLDLKLDKTLTFVKKDKEFTLERPQGKKLKKEKIEEYIRGLRNLIFDEFYPFSAPEVQKLTFGKNIKIHLKSKVIYSMSLAKNKKDYFLKVQALTAKAPKTIVVNKNADKEKLQSIGDMFQAQRNAQIFNKRHGSWIYKINESNYKKVVKKSTFFM